MAQECAPSAVSGLDEVAPPVSGLGLLVVATPFCGASFALVGYLKHGTVATAVERVVWAVAMKALRNPLGD